MMMAMDSHDDENDKDDSSNVTTTTTTTTTTTNDLEWKIEAAGRMYQSIKLMRLQNEQQQKKRLLRRRMRSLEDEHSWRKSSKNLVVVDHHRRQQGSQTNGNTSCPNLEQPVVVSTLLETVSTTDVKHRHGDIGRIEFLQEEHHDDHTTDVNKSLLSEDGTTLSNEITTFDSTSTHNEQQQQQGEELLKLREEQQDLLERLVRHQQQERSAWDQNHSILIAERDALHQERQEWKRKSIIKNELNSTEHNNDIDINNNDTNNKTQIMSLPMVTNPEYEMEEDDVAPTEMTTMMGLEQQVAFLQRRLTMEQQLRQQQAQEHDAKIRVASNALHSAMKRLEAFQELAIHLQSLLDESQKARVAEFKK
ncbi:hypothetical protein IV203_030264 [Nitzschia inconspicua]|uniref:Uncharacterized protein n=1 Tax=Nitzschia inconspicua TaxID=303405 RepID=A0A9K3LT74_9STRA|nr:hypothetical protein IV203_030264 [Nitzschia inconspicua]